MENKKLIFIEKAKEIHNDRYDYSLVEYKNTVKKIKILCNLHGIFEVRPADHISKKSGCPKCAKRGKSISTEEFIEKAKEIHNGRYDYSLVEYKSHSEKIRIICPIHGEFSCRAGFHTSSRDQTGCPKCSNRAKINQEEFIEKAKEIHNGRYDYSLVNYTTSKSKINIICSIHGEFYQEAHNHLNGAGCPKCGRIEAIKNCIKTNEEFIGKANKKHNNRYDYSLVNYTGQMNKIDIICPTHGIWSITPNFHLHSSANGCPKCKKEFNTNKNNINKEIALLEFIEISNRIHNNKYDYSLAEYKNTNTPLKIICPIHGIFEQWPKIHKKGAGCNKCSMIAHGIKSRKTPEQFILDAKEVHGEIYDYSLVNYKTDNDKIDIICKIHDKFSQKANTHLNGAGCPKCARIRINEASKGGYSYEYFINNPKEMDTKGCLYLAEFKYKSDHFYKIGITKKNLKERYYTEKRKDMDIIPIFEKFTPLYNAFDQEQNILKILKTYKYFPNFQFGGMSECFKIKPEVLQIISKYLNIII